MQALRWFSNVALALAILVGVAHAEDQMPWQPNIETARQIAAQTNRLVLIHFWAPWCKACAPLEKDVFSRGETARGLEANFVLVKLNFDDQPATARMYGVSSLPTDVIIAPNGRLVSQIQSPPTPAQYVAQMNQAAAGHRELARGATQPVATVAAQASSAPLSPALANPAAASTYGAPVTPAAASTPITAGGGTPAIATTAPPGGVMPTANQTAPPSTSADERYADYFRQQQLAQAQAAGPQSSAPPANAYAAAPPTVQTNPSPPTSTAPPTNTALQTNTAPQFSAVAPANPQVMPAAQASPYASAPVNQPTYGAPSAGGAQLQLSQSQPQRPQAPPLPPGCPAVGLDGYCPVTLVESKQWIMGDKTWGVVHRGRTYLFIGPAEKEKFLANPDRYSPVLSGLDPVLALDQQLTVPGRREFGVFSTDGRVYLFADEASLKRFDQNPKRYSAEAIQAMR